jgi:CRISPR/Cas system-associated exonuclease Cas4 (RecB family)
LGIALVPSFGLFPDVEFPEFWSPSRLNLLSSCRLRAAYSLDRSISAEFRKGNTFSALGIAAHNLTEMVWKNQFNAVSEVDVFNHLTSVWIDLVDAEYKRLLEEWSPAVVPLPRDWPFYAITQVRTINRVSEEFRTKMARGRGNANGSVRVEHLIRDQENKLEGKPDRVIVTGTGFYVLDLKTGYSLTSISESHRRQLLIYAHLVSTTTNEPLLGIGIVTASGETIWADEDLEDASLLLNEIRSDISDFRAKVDDSKFEELADPSPEKCRYCPFRGVCRSYWNDKNPEWLDQRGVMGKVVNAIDGMTLTIEQHFPIEGRGQLVGISNCVNSAKLGDFVSVTDGFLRGQSLRGSWHTNVLVIDFQI